MDLFDQSHGQGLILVFCPGHEGVSSALVYWLGYAESEAVRLHTDELIILHYMAQ